MKSDEVQCVPEIGPPLGFFLGRAGLDPKKDLRFTLAFLLPLTLQVSLEQPSSASVQEVGPDVSRSSYATPIGVVWLPVRLPLPSSRRRHLPGPQTNFMVSSRMARESKTLVPTSGSTTTPSSISHLDFVSYGTMSLNAERPMVRLSCCTPSNELAGGPNPTERHGKTQDQDPSQLNRKVWDITGLQEMPFERSRKRHAWRTSEESPDAWTSTKATVGLPHGAWAVELEGG